jgi:hypothetical protein
MQRVHAIRPAEYHATRQWNRFGRIVAHSDGRRVPPFILRQFPGTAIRPISQIETTMARRGHIYRIGDGMG